MAYTYWSLTEYEDILNMIFTYQKKDIPKIIKYIENNIHKYNHKSVTDLIDFIFGYTIYDEEYEFETYIEMMRMIDFLMYAADNVPNNKFSKQEILLSTIELCKDFEFRYIVKKYPDALVLSAEEKQTFNSKIEDLIMITCVDFLLEIIKVPLLYDMINTKWVKEIFVNNKVDMLNYLKEDKKRFKYFVSKLMGGKFKIENVGKLDIHLYKSFNKLLADEFNIDVKDLDIIYSFTS